MVNVASGAGNSFNASSIATEAAKFLGDNYVYGAAGPTTFDCSGLVQYTLIKLGLVNVPRTSEAQWAWVTKIPSSQVQPGDLVFGNFPGESSPGHVVIYAGNGEVIDAPTTGQKVQKIPLSSAFSGGVIVGYGRVPGSAQSAGGGVTGGGGLASGTGITLTSFKSDVAGIPLLGSMLSGVSWITGIAGEVDSTAKAIAGISNDISTAMNWASFLFMPSSWLRVGAFFAGVILLMMGAVMLAKSTGATPSVVPVPI
jgi:hypothetical protein